MEQEKMIAIMGSPGSGKTTAALKLALRLSDAKKNVIVVFCDPCTPVIPTVLRADIHHDTSLGSLLTAPALTQAMLLNACVTTDKNEYISFLGYRAGESLMQFPQITRDRAVDFFILLRYLADYIIIDCTSAFEADPASIVALELADKILKLGTANLKGVSYYLTHNPMLADTRFRKETHQSVISNLKPGQDWESAAQQNGGADFVLPYAPELEQQYDELTLLTPLYQLESSGYTAGIDKLIGIKSSKINTKANSNLVKDREGGEEGQKTKKRGKFTFHRQIFTKKRGEF